MSDDAGVGDTRTAAGEGLSAVEREDLLHALRVPRGRYNAERTAQLSGVPERTVYHWATSGVLVPDFADSAPEELVLPRSRVPAAAGVPAQPSRRAGRGRSDNPPP